MLSKGRESLIKMKQGLAIGYILEREGKKAKIRITGKPLCQINQDTDMESLANDGLMERSHHAGKVVDINDLLAVFPIKK